MAKSVLKTEFHGDDSHFQRAARRVSSEGREMGKKVGGALDRIRDKAAAAAGKLKLMAGAIGAALGAAAKAGGSEILDRFQEANRAGANFEKFQRLANVFSEFRLNADVAGDALTELRLALAEAGVEGGDKLEAFNALGLSIEKLGAMAPVDRFLALSEAVKRSDDKARALVATSKIFGEDVAPRLNEVLGLGARKLARQGEGQDIVTTEAALELRRMGANRRAEFRAIGINTAGRIGGKVIADDGGKLGLSDEIWGAFGSNPVKDAVEEGTMKGIRGAGGLLGEAGRLGGSSELRGLGYGGRDSGTPLSATARKNQTERDKFFREARERMGRNEEKVSRIVEVVESWEN